VVLSRALVPVPPAQQQGRWPLYSYFELGALPGVTAAERLRRVDALDLEPIVYKLLHPQPGETRMSLADADQDVALYRCFLKRCVLCPGATADQADRPRVAHLHAGHRQVPDRL
jgi:hypothetical protein